MKTWNSWDNSIYIALLSRVLPRVLHHGKNVAVITQWASWIQIYWNNRLSWVQLFVKLFGLKPFFSILCRIYAIFILHRTDQEIRKTFVRLSTIIIQRFLTWSGLWGGPPIPWWYITSCFKDIKLWMLKSALKFFISSLFTLSCCVICWCAAWLLWCFCISTAARASARLNKPSLRPENISPWKKDQVKVMKFMNFWTKISWKSKWIMNLKRFFVSTS